MKVELHGSASLFEGQSAAPERIAEAVALLNSNLDEVVVQARSVGEHRRELLAAITDEKMRQALIAADR